MEEARVVRPVGAEHVRRRAADDLPAAGGGDGVAAGLLAGDADAPRGDGDARSGPARGGDALVHAAQVGESGAEADHVHEVLRRRVDADHLFRREAAVLRHEIEVRPVLSAVDHGDLHHARRGAAAVVRPGDAFPREEVRHDAEGGVLSGSAGAAHAEGIVIDGEARIGDDRLHEAGEGVRGEVVREGLHAPVDVRADLAAEADEQARLAERKDGVCVFHRDPPPFT